MKRDRKTVESRRSQILEIIQAKKEIKVEDLADQFRISLMTARRDLQNLEDEHLIRRFYGGARSINAAEASTQANRCEQLEHIARYAAGKVQAGDLIFINGSQTALRILKYITVPNVRVLTNNGRCAMMDFPPNLSVSLTGGELKGHVGIMVGDNAMRNLLSAHVDKAFLGFAGISENGEVACNVPAEISINELMITHSQKYYIMVDHTKVGKTSNYASSSLARFDSLITDSDADEDVIANLQSVGLHVHIVK